MIKHDTASVFVFHHDHSLGWRVGLIEHPLFAAWMQPGGHVEHDETPHDAALREVREETGLPQPRLVDVHRPPALTATDTTVPMALPVWIVEHPILRGDNHVREAHVHIDFKYLAIADDAEPIAEPDHPFAWFTREQVADLNVLDDVRVISQILFDHVESLRPAG